jgi:uncharacterized protein YozE (UPF0346 family)
MYERISEFFENEGDFSENLTTDDIDEAIDEAVGFVDSHIMFIHIG